MSEEIENTNNTNEPKKAPESLDLSDIFWSSESSNLPLEDTSIPVRYEAVEESLVPDNPFETRYSVLRKASTQALEDSWDTGSLGVLGEDLAEPQYNPEQLCNLNDINVVRAKCIEAMAEYTVGLGYIIKKIDPRAESIDDDIVSRRIRRKMEEWASRDEKTFTELIKCVKVDEETTGNGYIEVSRNRRGEIDGLYHVPSHTMRIRRDRTGYVQQRGTQKVPFYRFGDKVKLTTDNRVEFLENRDPKINEIIHFKLSSTKSTYYGQPRDVAAFVTIAGDEMARNHNIKFFSHSATPELALVFTVDNPSMPTMAGNQPVKVSIPASVKQKIVHHFRKNLGTKYFEPGLFFLPNGVNLRIEKLSQGQKDSGWTQYRNSNRSEIRMAFRTPPVIIGDTENSTYATAAIEKSVYQEGVIAPEQERYQQRLMGLLWPELVMIQDKSLPVIIEEDGNPASPVQIKPEDSSGVDPDKWILEFKKMATADKAVVATNHQIYGNLRAVTVNEIRSEIGKRPIEGGDKPPEPASPGGASPTPGSNPNDIRGLAGRTGGGRGPNGAVSIPTPRRTGETNPGTPANITSVENPLSKKDDQSHADILRKVSELVEAVKFDMSDSLAKDELINAVESNPDIAERFDESYGELVDEGFSVFIDSLSPNHEKLPEN